MMLNRREFIAGASAFWLGGWRIYAAPPGWKHGGKPNLVLGVVSDTHLRTRHGPSGKIGHNWPDKYFAAALEYFKARNVDGVIHCGDFAHRGQVEEMQFHADVWNRVFPGNLAPDGHEVAKLFITGNHDKDGGHYGDFVKNCYPDEAERAKHVLATDMAANWQRIWGEKYEPLWHKVVKGYHFFGANYEKVTDAGTPKEFLRLADGCGLADSSKPFFFMTHMRTPAPLRETLVRSGNAVCLFGHNHCSASNWNVISLYYGRLPCIQVPSCEPRGSGAFAHDEYISKAKLEGRTDKGLVGMPRQGYVISIYDDMMVMARREFGAGGSLGADWVMPFGGGTGNGELGTGNGEHPFSKQELKKVIGEPQFRKGAKLEVSLDRIDKINKIGKPATDNPVNPVNPVQENPASPKLCVRIPLADGNPDSRVYAYEVVVIGEAGSQKLFKAVYAAGCNMGIGHETNGGVTTLEIAKDELPPGKSLTVAVRPLTSLGTAGRPIMTDFKV